jgi:hypothetical protein
MNLTPPARKRNIPVRLPQIPELLGELSAAPPPTTDAGRFIHRRHLVDPRIADLVAALAGIGLEETGR